MYQGSDNRGVITTGGRLSGLHTQNNVCILCASFIALSIKLLTLMICELATCPLRRFYNVKRLLDNEVLKLDYTILF